MVVAHALAMDALENPGPARPERVPGSICTTLFMPGVEPTSFPTDSATVVVSIADTLATYPHVSEEPPLQPYVLPEPGSSWATVLGAIWVFVLAARRAREN